MKMGEKQAVQKHFQNDVQAGMHKWCFNCYRKIKKYYYYHNYNAYIIFLISIYIEIRLNTIRYLAALLYVCVSYIISEMKQKQKLTNTKRKKKNQK